MKKSILLFCTVLLTLQLASGQQWIDKSYSYDSMLNVPYGSAIDFLGESEMLDMDIYLPNCDDDTHTSKRPLLVWIHGGAFIAGNKDDASIQALCKDFARRGYVTASINYRKGFVNDEGNWQCNYPNYSCVFATDSLEWSRAYYRAVQDAKGAIRYLVNRHEMYRIDTENVFVAGESAGAFTALGAALLDMPSERPTGTHAESDVQSPHSNADDCQHNQGRTNSGSPIARPDLGGIEGTIEPSTTPFTIKGVGNIFGAMLGDLLAEIPTNKPKPAIYSFHQPCDMVVSIDSNYVYWGLSWCFTNGYNCNRISNNEIMLYGSRTFSHWNTNNNYGYTIQNYFTSTSFPYNFFFGAGSCADQVNNPCHAYDNKARRELELANFFASRITTSPICDSEWVTSAEDFDLVSLSVFPNPTNDILYISGDQLRKVSEVVLFDFLGKRVYCKQAQSSVDLQIDMSSLRAGVYILQLHDISGGSRNMKVVKK